MTYKGYVIRRDSNASSPVMSARLDEAIAARLENRKWRYKLKLVHFRDGQVIDEGPWRKGPWGPVSDIFANSIRAEGKVGDNFTVRGVMRPVFNIKVIELDKGDLVIEAAKTEIGTRYVFGASNGPEDPGEDAFDCSGYTQWAWATVGVYLPHNAEAQRVASNVYNFSDESQAKNGDLVFMWFSNSGLPSYQASHVGLHLGDGSTGMVIDTRNPINEPVAIRPSAGVIGYGRPS